MIVVNRIDSLARSVADLAAITRKLEQSNVSLSATEQPITSAAAGRCFMKAATRGGVPPLMLRRGGGSMRVGCALPTPRSILGSVGPASIRRLSRRTRDQVRFRPFYKFAVSAVQSQRKFGQHRG
jgi:hypothetical protein